MKKLFLISVLFTILIAIPAASFAENPNNCTFGDESISADNIFERDFAVKAFVKKYPNAIRSVVIHDTTPLQGELSFTTEDNSKKEILLIKFNQNENGCYVPYAYHYSFKNEIINVTVKNSAGNFTEIFNLIHLDDKKIEDFYTKNCDPIQLDVVLEEDSKPYFCKSGNSIEMYLQEHIGGIIEVHIPDKVMDALFYNCGLNDDFSVLNGGEEIHYELSVEGNEKIFKMDLPSGYSKIEIIGFSYLSGDGGFCGSIWSNDSRYMSPLLQTKIGVEPWMVQCNDGLTLLLKPVESKEPVCVTDDTANKLIQRHWSIVVSRGA